MSSRDGQIEVIVRGIVRDRRGRVLVCKNAKRGYFYLPGGHAEFGESASAALVREFKEETGCRVKVGRLVATEEHLFRQRGCRRHEMNLVFHVELQGSRSVSSRESHIEFEWIELKRLKGLDIRPRSAVQIIEAGARRASPVWIASP